MRGRFGVLMAIALLGTIAVTSVGAASGGPGLTTPNVPTAFSPCPLPLASAPSDGCTEVWITEPPASTGATQVAIPDTVYGCGMGAYQPLYLDSEIVPPDGQVDAYGVVQCNVDVSFIFVGECAQRLVAGSWINWYCNNQYPSPPPLSYWPPNAAYNCVGTSSGSWRSYTAAAWYWPNGAGPENGSVASIQTLTAPCV